MTFTLKIQETIFKNTKLNEKISKNDVFKIMRSEEFSKYNKKLKDDGAMKMRLSNIGKKVKNDVLLVKYGRKLPFGRVYGFKCHTYQFITKKIKNSLCRNRYIDIDIVNAHYTIIYNICKLKGISVPHIKKYVKHREHIIKNYEEKFGLSRKKVKDMFNLMLYNIDEGYGDFIPNGVEYLDGLKAEIKNIALQVSNDNNAMKKKIKTYKKDKPYIELRSLFSYYIQEYENRVLEIIYKYLLENGFIKGKVATLFFDGIMVLKNDAITPHLLGVICNKVKTKMNMNIELIIKPMEDKLIDFDNMNIEIDDEKLKTFDSPFMNELVDYSAKRKYFNYFVKKIRHPIPMYVWEDPIDREKHILNATQLKETLLSVRSGEFNDKGDELPFYKVWMEDDSVKVYRKMDFLPFNPDLEDEHIENEEGDVYNLFVGYGDHIHTKYKKKKRAKIIKPWIDLVYQLVGAKKENMDYYIAFLSQMVREPREKVGISVVFKSEQGVGKNVHLIPLENILKDTHYKSSSNPEDFFGAYAEGYYRKILVNMDEVELKSSFKNEGKMKTAITEPKLTINPKFLRPIEVLNFARTIMFSNKDYILPIDVKSGDRRFIVYGSTTYYLKYGSDSWIKLIKYFKSPIFISALYDYFMEYDYSDVNWIKDRPITEEYKKLLKQFIPATALFMNKWVLDTEPVIWDIDNDMDEDEKRDTTERNEEALKRIKEPYEMDKNNFYRDFKSYIDDNNLAGRDYKPSIKNFENELANYVGVEMVNNEYKLTRESVKCYLISKKYMDCDLEEYQHLLKKEVIEFATDYFYEESDDEEKVDE